MTSQRRISPHEGQEGGSIGPASAAASFGWRNGCASPGEGVDSCRQRSQIGNPGLYAFLEEDPPDRRGFIESQHIAGLYELWDEIIRRTGL